MWIWVTELRKKLWEFLNFWAIGTLFGSTQTVDMETTHKSSFGRIFVAVLDPKLLPPKLNVIIGDHYFELKFEIESKGFDENGDEVEMHFTDGDDNGTQDMEEDDPNGENNADREAKRSRSEDVGSENQTQVHPSSTDVTVSMPPSKKSASMSSKQRAEMEEKIQKMVDEIIETAMNRTLEACADKVLAEDDLGEVEGMVEDVFTDDDDDLLDEPENGDNTLMYRGQHGGSRYKEECFNL